MLPAYPTVIFLLCLHDSVTLCVPEFPAAAIVLQLQQFWRSYSSYTVPTVPAASTFPTVPTDPADLRS